MRSRRLSPCLRYEQWSTTSPTARPVDDRPRHILAALLAAFGLSALAACASVPEVNSVVESPRVASTSPTLVSANGPLTPQESRVVLSRLQQEAGGNNLLRRHLAVEQAVAGGPLTIGNRTRLLRDGPESFAAVFAAIRAAKHHINLEYYILQDIAYDGQHLGELLQAKRRAGVQVNIIYDSYGSIDTPVAFFDSLKSAGVNLVEFNPLNPLAAKGGYAPNARDHRKILIVDGARAILGGVNLSTTYEGSAFSGASKRAAETPEHWRDTDIEIEGPAIAEVQKLFLESWRRQGGPALADAAFFPTARAEGSEIVRIVGSTPNDSIPRYYATLVSAIDSAEKSVWITTAYFVPTDQEVTSLKRAARRGVDVRLLLPGESDAPLALARGHFHYEDLMDAGVKIFETHGEVLHSKTTVIDGVWSAVGSSNFDHRSVLFNDEIDAIVLGPRTAAQLEAFFEQDLRNATPVDPQAWGDRPLPEKAEEVFTLFWEKML